METTYFVGKSGLRKWRKLLNVHRILGLAKGLAPSRDGFPTLKVAPIRQTGFHQMEHLF